MSMTDDRALAALVALTHGTRLGVLRLLLRQGPDGMPAGEIARATSVPPSTLSSHLAQLEGAGLLRSCRLGQRIIYTAVTLCFVIRREIGLRDAGLYLLAQVAGGICGATLAHGMFEEPIVAASTNARTGFSQWLGEFTATFGLVATLLFRLLCIPARPGQDRKVSLTKDARNFPFGEVTPFYRSSSVLSHMHCGAAEYFDRLRANRSIREMRS